MAILLYTLLVLLLLTLALLAWLVVRTGRDAPDRDALIDDVMKMLVKVR